MSDPERPLEPPEEKPAPRCPYCGEECETLYVSQRFEEETGKKVRRLQAMLYNPLYPFAHADVDRMVCGEDAGLECKTTSTLDVKQFHGVEFPEKYYAQCVHYMAVTGCEHWYLAVLVFGRGFFVYTLERDQAEIDALMTAEQGFWAGYVETDTPPGPDGSDATTEAMQTIYSDSRPEERTLFGRDMILDEYCTLKRQSKAIKDRMSEIENIIKEDMQDAERGNCDRYTVSWKSQIRKAFDAKAFSAAHPEIDIQPYYKVSTARPFKVQEQANEE